LEDFIICPSCKNRVSIAYTFCPYCGFDLRPLIRIKMSKEVNSLDIFIYRMKNFLLKPDDVFKDIALRSDNLGPILILFTMAFFISLRIFLVPQIVNIYNYVLFLALSLISIFLFLMFFSLIIHIIVKLVGGYGNFSVTFNNFVYALIPSILGVIINTILSFSLPLPLPTIPNLVPIKGPFETALLIQSFFMLISAFYFSFGLRYSHGLNKITSLLVSYVSFGLIILVMFST